MKEVVSLEHIRVNSYWKLVKLVKVCVLYPEHHEADVNIQAVTYDTYHSAVTIWGSYRQQLWSVVFMDTCAILQAYPTYIQVPDKLSSQIVHYYELWEADFQYWKGNLRAFVSQKWVRENNSLNYHAAKLLYFTTCYLLQFQTLKVFK